MLIESNAMKRLITLFASVVLLCPIGAGAQIPYNGNTVQTSVGSFIPLLFQFQRGIPLSIPSTIVAINYNSTSPSYISVNSITNLTITLYMPNNGSQSFGLTGVAYTPDNQPIVVSGAVLYNGTNGYYTVQINIGTTAFVCALSTVSLNGTCQGTPSQGPVSVSYQTQL